MWRKAGQTERKEEKREILGEGKRRWGEGGPRRAKTPRIAVSTQNLTASQRSFHGIIQ